jgi:hypothetical protein
LQEVTNFTTKYYAEHLPSVHNPPPRYNAGTNESNLNLFRGQLRGASGSTFKALSLEKWRTIMIYILRNLDEVRPYIKKVVNKGPHFLSCILPHLHPTSFDLV